MTVASVTRRYTWEVLKVLWHNVLILWMPACLIIGIWLTQIPATTHHMRRVVYRVLAVWVPLTAIWWYNMACWPCRWYHWAWFVCGDLFYFVSLWAMIVLEGMVRQKDSNTNRLLNFKKFYGRRICILGNGPSLVNGGPMGEIIDTFDEIVRFNNCLIKGYERFVGSRCTVHMGDAQLQISWPEYKIEGATWILSTVLATMNTAISVILFRGVYDLELQATLEVVKNKELGWMAYEDIKALRDELGFAARTMPTSGCLAIHWFVNNRPDPTVPIYIHGFDFFQGPTFHYYSNEPLWQQIVNRLGLWFGHDPLREKAYVMKLIDEGKVKWLTDLAKEPSQDASMNDTPAVTAPEPPSPSTPREPTPKKARTS